MQEKWKTQGVSFLVTIHHKHITVACRCTGMEVATFSCFFLMLLLLLLLKQELCLLKRARLQLNEYRGLHTDGQTHSCSRSSLNEVSLFSLSFICFLLPNKTPRIK